MTQPPWPPEDPTPAFTQATENEPDTTLLAEFWLFLHANKKWWLLPVPTVLLLSALILPTASPAAPFIYSLF